MFLWFSFEKKCCVDLNIWFQVDVEGDLVTLDDVKCDSASISWFDENGSCTVGDF